MLPYEALHILPAMLKRLFSTYPMLYVACNVTDDCLLNCRAITTMKFVEFTDNKIHERDKWVPCILSKISDQAAPHRLLN